MPDSNGKFFNGRASVAVYSIGGVTGIGALFGIFSAIISWHVAPVKEALAETKLEVIRIVARHDAEIGRISTLAAERGIAIPRLQADVVQLREELTRLRERILQQERVSPERGPR